MIEVPESTSSMHNREAIAAHGYIIENNNMT